MGNLATHARGARYLSHVPYDEGLAERVRAVLEDRPGVTERKMFGGLAFMLHGNMCVGVLGEELVVRVARDEGESILASGAEDVRAMDFTGRPMAGFLLVDGEAVSEDAELERWIARASAYAGSLPAK